MSLRTVLDTSRWVLTSVTPAAAFRPPVRPRHPPRDPTSPYLTAREAAAYCRVSLKTLYNHRRHIARLPGVRKLLFRREDLDAWLAKRRKRRR